MSVVRSYKIERDEMRASVVLKQKAKEGVLKGIRGGLEETVETEKKGAKLRIVVGCSKVICGKQFGKEKKRGGKGLWLVFSGIYFGM